MSAEGVNKIRRRLLVAATSIVGAAGTGYALVPFVASMNPSARARAAGAPVEADVSKLEPGALLRVKWRGKPVWVVHRTPEMIAALASNDPKLVDPKSEVDHQPSYCQNQRGRSNRNTWWQLGFVPIWAVRQLIVLNLERKTSVRIGRVVSIVRVMVHALTSQRGCSKTCQLQPIFTFPSTPISTPPPSWSVKIEEERPDER